MKKILIRTGTGEAFNAASKARRDAETIALRAGYIPFDFAGKRTADGSLLGAARLALDGVRNWRRLIREAEAGSLVLIQYPHYPMKSARLMKSMIPRAKRKKGLKFVALVHDLDSLRGLHGQAAVYSDRQLLKRFDTVIVHNSHMHDYLREEGFPEVKIMELGLFDYLTDAPTQAHKPEDGIAIAGNLDPEKSGYVRAFVQMKGREIPLHLYGVRYPEGETTENAVYHGAFSPEELPGKLEGAFGLVWDGEDIHTCRGATGEYLRYNDPHKASLYLASGMPVLIWDQAAIADMIRKEQAGLTISSLAEAGEAISTLSGEEYERLRKNAERIGAELRSGSRLKKVFGNLQGGRT